MHKRLGAVDYAPGRLGARGEQIFFQKNLFFKRNFFVSNNSFFSEKQLFYNFSCKTFHTNGIV